jgi:hypothetical protein
LGDAVGANVGALDGAFDEDTDVDETDVDETDVDDIVDVVGTPVGANVVVDGIVFESTFEMNGMFTVNNRLLRWQHFAISLV